MSDKYAVSNKLPAKQVNILAQRKKRILVKENVISQRRKVRIARFARRKKDFKTIESFVLQNIKAEKTQKRMRAIMLKGNPLKVPHTDKKLLVVFRHAGVRIADETTNKILKTLRLHKRYKAVLLRNDKETNVLLKLVEPYVIFGYPTISTVRDLIFKKGFAVVNGKKTSIQSNVMIEEQLGEHGIICIEDIVHELFTVGPNFDIASKFLCPFTLQVPRDGWKAKVSVSFARGGEYGNRKELVNDVIARCM